MNTIITNQEFEGAVSEIFENIKTPANETNTKYSRDLVTITLSYKDKNGADISQYDLQQILENDFINGVFKVNNGIQYTMVVNDGEIVVRLSKESIIKKILMEKGVHVDTYSDVDHYLSLPYDDFTIEMYAGGNNDIPEMRLSSSQLKDRMVTTSRELDSSDIELLIGELTNELAQRNFKNNAEDIVKLFSMFLIDEKMLTSESKKNVPFKEGSYTITDDGFLKVPKYYLELKFVKMILIAGLVKYIVEYDSLLIKTNEEFYKHLNLNIDRAEICKKVNKMYKMGLSKRTAKIKKFIANKAEELDLLTNTFSNVKVESGDENIVIDVEINNTKLSNIIHFTHDVLVKQGLVKNVRIDTRVNEYQILIPLVHECSPYDYIKYDKFLGLTMV